MMARLALWIADGCRDYEQTKEWVDEELFREACNEAVSEARRINRNQAGIPRNKDFPCHSADDHPLEMAKKLNQLLGRNLVFTEDGPEALADGSDIMAIVDKEMNVAEETLRHFQLQENPVHRGEWKRKL